MCLVLCAHGNKTFILGASKPMGEGAHEMNPKHTNLKKEK